MQHKTKDKFHQSYGMPKIYDELVKYEDPKNIILKNILKITSFNNKIVLDVGSGTGKYPILLSKKAKLVYALEPSKEFVNHISKKIKEKSIKNIKVIKGKVENIKLKNDSVDIVLSTWAFLSSLVNKNKGFKEVMRVLKKKGCIIIADNHYDCEFIEIWRKTCEPRIAGYSLTCMKELLDLAPFKTKLIKTYFDFPTIKDAARLVGFILGSKGKQYLLKNKKSKIEMKVFIAYFKK